MGVIKVLFTIAAAVSYLLTPVNLCAREHTLICSVPTHKSYYSSNKEVSFEVTPGSRRWENSEGALLRLGADKKYHKVWSSRLTNEVAPEHALISNTGRYVVTIDNWCAAGYGDNVVVIYGPGGGLVRKLGLKSVATKEEIDRLDFTDDGAWWGGEHYLVEESNLLVLKVFTGGVGRAPSEREYREVRISLATGRILSTAGSP
jgi:hypothetical protein